METYIKTYFNVPDKCKILLSNKILNSIVVSTDCEMTIELENGVKSSMNIVSDKTYFIETAQIQSIVFDKFVPKCVIKISIQ